MLVEELEESVDQVNIVKCVYAHPAGVCTRPDPFQVDGVRKPARFRKPAALTMSR